MFLNDQQIRQRCQSERPLIRPFAESTRHDSQGRRVLSYGLSSAGYDLRLARTLRVPLSLGWITGGDGLDPLGSSHEWFSAPVSVATPYFILPPKQFVLAHSVEYIQMPDDLFGIAVGKSSYARIGVFCNITPVEPGWCGQLTIEIANLGSQPVRIYVEQGIAQLVFAKIETPQAAYAQRSGKYQNSQGVVLAQ